MMGLKKILVGTLLSFTLGALPLEVLAQTTTKGSAGRSRSWNRKDESGKYRQGFGSYAGRGRREASKLQKGDTGKDTSLEAGIDKKVSGALGPNKEIDPNLKNGCDGKYTVLGGEASLGAGVKKGDGKSKLSNLTCSAGVQGTLASAGFECVKILAGDKDNGVDVRGSGNAGGAATLMCKCDGPGVVCEAFIGVKAEADGNIGGAICGLRLALGLGGEVGAGAGGKAQVGYVKGKGYGLALAGYVGVGAGVKVYVDPQLGALLESNTYTCLFDKAKGVYTATVNGLKGAANRLGGLFSRGSSSVGKFLRP